MSTLLDRLLSALRQPLDGRAARHAGASIAFALCACAHAGAAGAAGAAEPVAPAAFPAATASAPAVAAAEAARQAADPVVARTEARVMLANRQVALLRGPFLGVDAQGRARRAEAALHELAAAGGPGHVEIRVEPQGRALLVDGQLALFMVPTDADPLKGETLEQASVAVRDAMQRALDETREARQTRRLLASAALALGVTLLAGASIGLVWRARRAATRRMAAVVQHGHGLTIAGLPVVTSDSLAGVTSLVIRIGTSVVVLVIVYQWLGFVLSQFPYTRPWGEQLTGFLLGVATHIGSKTLHAIPDLAVAVLILLIARGVIVMMRPVFARAAVSGRTTGGWLDADTVGPTQRLFAIAVVLFALVMAYPYLPGSDSEAFKGLSVLVGLMITIGGSNLFSQVASGFVLMYSRTLRVGEYVRIGEHEGTVTRLGGYTVRIRTGMGEELTLPNALVVGSVTKNYSRVAAGVGYVVDTTVTIGYDTPWRQVEAMLLEAARRTPDALHDPPPRVFQTGLADFYPTYRLVLLATPEQPRPRAELLSALHANIQDVFNEHGVQIMSPHYLGDPATAKVVPPADWYKAPARPPADAGEADTGLGPQLPRT